MSEKKLWLTANINVDELNIDKDKQKQKRYERGVGNRVCLFWHFSHCIALQEANKQPTAEQCESGNQKGELILNISLQDNTMRPMPVQFSLTPKESWCGEPSWDTSASSSALQVADQGSSLT